MGVAGNGQAELAASLRAQHPDGGHIPEDRTRDGIVVQAPSPRTWLSKTRRWNRRAALRHAQEMIALYSIRAHSPTQRAGDLSGGNQQKVILARELHPRPRVIVAAEPTRGLDIEATRFVHDEFRDAAAGGARITLITSDPRRGRFQLAGHRSTSFYREEKPQPAPIGAGRGFAARRVTRTGGRRAAAAASRVGRDERDARAAGRGVAELMVHEGVASMSRPRVGSAATMRSGRGWSSRARITFCWLPPEGRRRAGWGVGAEWSRERSFPARGAGRRGGSSAASSKPGSRRWRGQPGRSRVRSPGHGRRPDAARVARRPVRPGHYRPRPR